MPRSRRAEPPPIPATPVRWNLWIALVLGAVTVALYWPVHGYDFVAFDDVDYVVGNPPVRAGLTRDSVLWALTTLHMSFYVPVTWLSFLVDAELYGMEAGGFHVTNVVLHVASSILLFLLLVRATGRQWPSALVAALFAWHPLHVESVAWVTERKDVMSTLFLFFTLAAYGAYVARPTRGRYLGTLGVFALGLMAKPMLTTMPVLLLLLDRWPLRRFAGLPSLRLVLEKLPFLLLAIPSALVTMVSGGHVSVSDPLEGVDLGARLANVCDTYVVYLWQTIWPIGLAVLYPEQDAPLWRAGLAALALAAATAVALRMEARRPWVTVGWLWYLVALLPVIGFFKTGHYARADRFTYMPHIGIFVLVVWEAAELVTSRRRTLIASAVATVALAGALVISRVQIGYWRDTVTLFERTIAVTGDNPVSQYLLGLGLQDRGQLDEAIARFRESLRLRPNYAHAHTSLGVLLFARGQVDEAIAHYAAALREDPTEAYAHGNLANALEQQGRHADALAHYREALRIEPDLAEVRNSYGKALAGQGRLEEAMTEYAAALRLAPESAEIYNNLGNALADQGRFEEAVAHLNTALRLRPDYAAAQVNLAILLAEQGRFPEAAEHYRAALRLRPDDARTHADLGNVLAAQNQLDEAVGHYLEALRLEPGFALAHNNLANTLVMLGRVDEGLAHYADALRLDPAYAEAHYNLGLTLETRGRIAEAREHFAAALRIVPGHAAARQHLDSLGGP